jgi:hypothetical protein
MNLLRRCYECGHPLGKRDLFCPRCGVRQPRDPKHGSHFTRRAQPGQGGKNPGRSLLQSQQ